MNAKRKMMGAMIYSDTFVLFFANMVMVPITVTIVNRVIFMIGFINVFMVPLFKSYCKDTLSISVLPYIMADYPAPLSFDFC